PFAVVFVSLSGRCAPPPVPSAVVVFFVFEGVAPRRPRRYIMTDQSVILPDRAWSTTSAGREGAARHALAQPRAGRGRVRRAGTNGAPPFSLPRSTSLPRAALP